MYQRILVALDGSEPSHEALAEALRLAGEAHSQLRFVHVVDIANSYRAEAEGWSDASKIEKQLYDDGRRILDEAVVAAQAKGLSAETLLREAVTQRISDVIIDEASRWPAELIVAGTHGRGGIGQLLLGSVATNIARKTPVPLLLVRVQRSAPDKK
ncbi:MAG TPA: universal stress protein [Nitrolancea sp.]|nr:universal stress protein [Nitrolancea sp.]